MRSDMASVICDRPRVNGDGGKSIPHKGYKKYLDKAMKNDGEGLPKKEPMDSKKEFGEHLGPLKRYALSCVGRHWDDVYSEVCQNIDKGSVTQNHILTHLYDYIARDVMFNDEGEIVRNEYPFAPPYGALVYVHPDTGIVTKNKHTNRYRREKKPEKLIKTGWVDKNTFYLQDHNGIWWTCWMREVPKRSWHKYKFYPMNPARMTEADIAYRKKKKNTFLDGYWIYHKVWDVFLQDTVQEGDYRLDRAYGTKCTHYTYKKLQMNKAEIRRIKKKYGVE
jgi:hypothetical protein